MLDERGRVSFEESVPESCALPGSALKRGKWEASPETVWRDRVRNRSRFENGCRRHAKRRPHQGPPCPRRSTKGRGKRNEPALDLSFSNSEKASLTPSRLVLQSATGTTVLPSALISLKIVVL